MSSPAWETGQGFFRRKGGNWKQIAQSFLLRYSNRTHAPAMKYLTKEQQKVLCVILLLLLTGLAVKTWRKAHPSNRPDNSIAK